MLTSFASSASTELPDQYVLELSKAAAKIHFFLSGKIFFDFFSSIFSKNQKQQMHTFACRLEIIRAPHYPFHSRRLRKQMAETTAYQNELKNVTKNAGITAAGLIVMNVMAFVNNAIITRTIGADQYGMFVLATRILEFLTIASALGLSHSLIRFVSMYKGKNDQESIKGVTFYTFRTLLVASLGFAVTIFWLAPIISTAFFDRPELSYYLQILMIALPFSVMMIAINNSFIGLKLVKYQVILANIATPLLFFALISATFLLGYRLEGLIWVHISIFIIITIAAWILFRKLYQSKTKHITPKVDRKEIWDYNLPVYISQFANTAFRFSPIFIMGYFLSNEEIAIFNVSYKVGALVLFSMSAFQMIFMPTISGLFATKDIPTISGLLKTVTKWIFTFSLIVFAMVLAFSETILGIFGAEFTTGTLVLILLMSGELVNASTGLIGSTILMSGRSRVVLANSLAQFAIVAGLAWWLTPIYGNLGTAFAYAVSLIIMNIMRLIELYHFEKIHPYKLSFFKPLIATIAGFLPVYFLSQWTDLNIYLEMILGFFVFMMFFISTLLLLRLDEDDRYILGTILAQIKFRKK
jgi:O-antigen/teichoic acid export membrane protein